MSDAPLPDDALLFSRRAFLGRFAALGALTVTAGALAACGGSSSSGGGGAIGADVVDSASCTGYSALTEPQLATRSSLGYIDETANPAQHCANCRFFQAPTASPCGGCQVLPGPVSPAGYCRTWAAAAV